MQNKKSELETAVRNTLNLFRSQFQDWGFSFDLVNVLNGDVSCAVKLRATDVSATYDFGFICKTSADVLIELRKCIESMGQSQRHLQAAFDQVELYRDFDSRAMDAFTAFEEELMRFFPGVEINISEVPGRISITLDAIACPG